MKMNNLNKPNTASKFVSSNTMGTSYPTQQQMIKMNQNMNMNVNQRQHPQVLLQGQGNDHGFQMQPIMMGHNSHSHPMQTQQLQAGAPMAQHNNLLAFQAAQQHGQAQNEQRSKSGKNGNKHGNQKNPSFENQNHQRGYSMDQQKYNTQNLYNRGHGNVMILHQDQVSNFTKGASLPQQPNSTNNGNKPRLLPGGQRHHAATQLANTQQMGPMTFQHQQRKLNQSPVMKNQQQKMGMQGKRAQSKNDKYDTHGSGHPMPLQMYEQQQTYNQNQFYQTKGVKKSNMPGLNSTQQRYSPLSNYMKNQNSKQEIQKRITAANHGINRNNYIRPSSANTKRKDNASAGAMGNNSEYEMRQFMANSGTGMTMNNSKNKITHARTPVGNSGVGQKKSQGNKSKGGYSNDQSLPQSMEGFGNLTGHINMNPQEYLNGVLSPNMIQGPNYFSQTQAAHQNPVRKSHGFQNDGRKTQQETKPKTKGQARSGGNQTQLQMYSNKQATKLVPAVPLQTSASGGQQQNTVNMNINITNIGLPNNQQPIMGVQTNPLSMAGVPHKRSQSQAQRQHTKDSKDQLVHKKSNSVQKQNENAPSQKNIGVDQKQQVRQNSKDRRSEDQFGKRPKSNATQRENSQPQKKRPNSKQQNKEGLPKQQPDTAQQQIEKAMKANQAHAQIQQQLQQQQIQNQMQKQQQQAHPQTPNIQAIVERQQAQQVKPVKPQNPAYSQPFSYYSSNPKQMYTNAVTKFAFATKTGLSPSNPKKVNQDIWITVPHFCGFKYSHFFAVCDGHGQYGEKVSAFLKQRLPQYLDSELRYVLRKYTEDLQQNQKDQALNTDEICIAFNNAFLNCNDELFSGLIDIKFSGSTCVTVLTMGQKLFCSNVGDSRGIVVKKRAGDAGKHFAQAISRDQKPCQADEAARIQKYGGRIDSFRDPDKNPIGPLRVWLKEQDIPGLAMTRSFGDEVASRVGVTAEPEILELDLSPDDRFIVLASDGVWEFLSNDDIAKIVMPYFECKNAEKAAEAVVRESYLKWKEEEDDIIDDITCVIIFLDVKMPQQEPNEHLQQQQQECEASMLEADSPLDPNSTKM